MREDGSWISYQSGTLQDTGQLAEDDKDLKRYVSLDKEPVVGKKFKITFYDEAGGDLMSTRVDLLIQELAILGQGSTYTLSSWWSDDWKNPLLGSSSGFHHSSSNPDFWIQIDFPNANPYYVNEILLQKRGDSVNY